MVMAIVCKLDIFRYLGISGGFDGLIILFKKTSTILVGISTKRFTVVPRYFREKMLGSGLFYCSASWRKSTQGLGPF